VARVLIVDDDLHIRQFLSYALTDEGYEVLEASDGQQALDLIDSSEPDAIVLDMKMPGMDGWEFARQYRQRASQQAPIIVLTAAQDAEKRALDVEAVRFVAKPFDLDYLVEQLASLLASSGIQ
jgi:DNA-binding response OmpR family regulator